MTFNSAVTVLPLAIPVLLRMWSGHASAVANTACASRAEIIGDRDEEKEF